MNMKLPSRQGAAKAQRAASGRTSCIRVHCQHGKQPLQKALQAGAAVFASASLLCAGPAFADLNVYEADAGGEFGRGSAQQFGEATLNGQDFSGQDLRRSNFTSAEARGTNFKDCNLQGAYFIKAALPDAIFENANLSDTLMDRAVMVKSNLRNANLTRAVLTRSDLTGADVKGADFSNALVDKAQQIALCRYADGVNTVTGVPTRVSLGCGSMRKFRESTPSNPEGPQVSAEDKDAFRATLPTYRQ